MLQTEQASSNVPQPDIGTKVLVSSYEDSQLRADVSLFRTRQDLSQPRVLGLLPLHRRSLVDEVDGDVGVVEVVVVRRPGADFDVAAFADDTRQSGRNVAVRRGRELPENSAKKETDVGSSLGQLGLKHGALWLRIPTSNSSLIGCCWD